MLPRLFTIWPCPINRLEIMHPSWTRPRNCIVWSYNYYMMELTSHHHHRQSPNGPWHLQDWVVLTTCLKSVIPMAITTRHKNADSMRWKICVIKHCYSTKNQKYLVYSWMYLWLRNHLSPLLHKNVIELQLDMYKFSPKKTWFRWCGYPATSSKNFFSSQTFLSFQILSPKPRIIFLLHSELFCLLWKY